MRPIKLFMRRLGSKPFVIAFSALFLSTGLRTFGVDSVSIRGQVIAGGKPVPGAVVWIEAPDAPRPPRHAVLDQRNLTFMPSVLAVSTGSTVRFPNNDTVLHNVFSFHDGKKFDLGLYPVGQVRDVKFDHAGVSRIFCNIHSGMAAYVVAVDSPYYAVTDRAGEFSLAAVPFGQYTYHAWRAGAATISGTVTIAPNTTLRVQWPAD
jgi:plastocyanin